MKKFTEFLASIIFSFFLINVSFSANDENIYDKIDLFSEVLDKIKQRIC